MRPILYLGIGLLAAAAQCIYCPMNITEYGQDRYAWIWQMSNGVSTIDLARLAVQLTGTVVLFGGLALISHDGRRQWLTESPAR